MAGIYRKDPRAIGRAISIVEEGDQRAGAILQGLEDECVLEAAFLGITGSVGVGKSTLVGNLVSHYRKQGHRVGIVAVDPSSPVSGGAILGDRIRMMQHAVDQDVVIRSMATRGRLGGLCAAAGAAVRIMACSGCNPVIIETVGVGQAEIDVVGLADITVLVLSPGLGDDIQAMKAGLLEIADIIAINKSDHPDADALVMEMESVAHGRDCPICRTVATQSIGIEHLAAVIEGVEQKRRKNGQFALNRQMAREIEVLDWAVEMARAKLKDRLSSRDWEIKGDLRALARSLVEDVCPLPKESQYRISNRE